MKLTLARVTGGRPGWPTATLCDSRAAERFTLTVDFAICEDQVMRIVSRKAIREATARHSEWGASLNAWYKIARNADWKTFADVRNSWKNSDLVGRYVVFDVSHNKCRLIATIQYKWRMVYIRSILSHAEYDQGRWQSS